MNIFHKKIIPQNALEFIKTNGLQIILRDQLTTLRDTSNKASKHSSTLKTSPSKSSQDYTHLEYQMFHVCHKMIGDDYFRRLFHKVFDNLNESFDFVIIIKGVSEEDIQVKNVVGYMITEIGECPMQEYKDIPVLNLICTSSSFSSQGAPIGRILLFLYVFTLKQRHFSNGLLELANNYSNTAGLCLYNKFGFREYIPLKRSCFNDDFDTLPMIVHLDNPQMTEDAMIAALVKSTNIPVLPEQDLCVKGAINGPNGIGQKKEIKRRTDNFMNMMKINELFNAAKSADQLLISENRKQNELTENDDVLEELAKKTLAGKNIIYVYRIKRSRSPTSWTRTLRPRKTKAKAKTKTKTKIRRTRLQTRRLRAHQN